MSSNTDLKRVGILLASFAMTGAWAIGISHISPDAVPSLGEEIATATTIACVWMTRRDDIWCWPVGIISVLFLAVALYGYNMTAQVWLQLAYFLPIQVLSWIWWRKREELPIKIGGWAVNALSLICSAFIAVLAAEFLGSDKIGLWFWVDGWVTGASIVAQYIMGRRYAESWLWWAFAVNIPSIILFIATDAYMLAALYLGFFVHAILGWLEWSKAADLVLLQEWKISCEEQAV